MSGFNAPSALHVAVILAIVEVPGPWPRRVSAIVGIAFAAMALL